jgi:hypothetical protein
MAALLALLFLVVAPAAQGQAPPKSAMPCRDGGCLLNVEWGTAERRLIPDRKYGHAGLYEGLVLDELAQNGWTFHTGTEGEPAVTFRLRPVLTVAICDVVPGTATDYTCQAIRETVADVMVHREGLVLPRQIRLRNTCSADGFAHVTRFAAFTADVIAWELSGRAFERPTVGAC